MDVMDDADEPLDPRIQIELENLNTATDDINKLEIELDEAHTAFNKLLTESTRKLKEFANKVGPSCIEKARCYYEAVEVARRAQVQCQLQAHLFQRASEIHAAAKETVALAETRFMSHKNEWNFDQAWQDMLNHATIKVMDADNQKAECGREHHRKAMLFHDAEKKVQQLEEKHRRAIIKARPYFELLASCDQKLATQKERVGCLKEAVKDAKQAYSRSFRALEEISNQIHQQRRDYDIMVNGPREPGVGAELISPEESLNYEAELKKVTISRLNSVTSSEPDNDDRDQDFQDILELKQRMENFGGRSVDGSESKSNQWELELQASMEKLNNLSKNSDWHSDKENDSLDESRNGLNKRQLNLPSTSKFNLPLTDMNLENGQSELLKVPMDFHVLKKVSFNAISNGPGWQSLTQSPINSILSRSKVAIKKSLSKSLSNSPVNIGFNFGRSKVENVETDPSLDQSDDEIHSQNVASSNKSSSSPSNDNQKDSQTDTDDNNEESTTSDNSMEASTFSKPEHSKSPINNHSTPVELRSSSNPAGSSDSVSPQNLVESPKIKEPSYKTSSVKELPLLSIFGECSSVPYISKDRSCSLINLAEKKNLRTSLDNSELRNIQAVSVERLANARHNLMANHADNKRE